MKVVRTNIDRPVCLARTSSHLSNYHLQRHSALPRAILCLALLDYNRDSYHIIADRGKP